MAMILDRNNYPDSYNSQMQRPARGQTQLSRWRRDGSVNTNGDVYRRSSSKRDYTNQIMNLSLSASGSNGTERRKYCLESKKFSPCAHLLQGRI